MDLLKFYDKYSIALDKKENPQNSFLISAGKYIL